MNLKELSIGIELGSTRIKAVIIDKKFEIIASSEYGWENSFLDGVWTYSLDEAKKGVQETFKGLMNVFKEKFNQDLTTCGYIGVSGMMHGYLVFDKDMHQLAPFRTWRNTMTSEAASALTKEFNFHIPQRWSVSHLYESILDEKKEVKDIRYATTLAGYIHYLLTDCFVVGIGEASGMFPIDEKTKNYNKEMLLKFNNLIKNKVDYKLEDVFPKVLVSGENAGYLTDKGAKFLDPTGVFQAGVPLCPPEGDMGTGMVATNSCSVNTGNASIGTSSNVTIVTGKYIKSSDAIDLITSPAGLPAALIHVNNGTSDINKWVNLFDQVLKLFGTNVSKNDLYTKLFEVSLASDKGKTELYHLNYDSGEPIISINEGRPMFIRKPNSKMDLADFMASNLYSVFGVIRYGLDILKNDNVYVNKITGHGGFFKTENVSTKIMANALNVKVETLSSAGEGGPYGMALLASYNLNKEENETLEDYLEKKVFKNLKINIIEPDQEGVEWFNKYYENYIKMIDVENKAIKNLKI